MKKILFMFVIGGLLSFRNCFADTLIKIAPEALERAMSGIHVESTDKSLADLFDADMLVDLTVRRYPEQHIDLQTILPACQRVIKANKLHIIEIDKIKDIVIDKKDVDIIDFCKQFVNNIVKHHNAVVEERRADFNYGVFPTKKIIVSEDGQYYVSRIDISHIDITDVANQAQQDALSSMFAVFKTSDDSVVCVLSRGQLSACKSDKDGILFEVAPDGFYYHTKEECAYSTYCMEMYNLAPFGLKLYNDRLTKYLKHINQSDTNKVQVAAGLY